MCDTTLLMELDDAHIFAGGISNLLTLLVVGGRLGNFRFDTDGRLDTGGINGAELTDPMLWNILYSGGISQVTALEFIFQ